MLKLLRADEGADVKQEDEDEFSAFLEGAWARLFRTAHALTGSRHDAEDLLQNAFTRTFSSWGRVRAAGNPEAYVRRIVVNEAASAGRRRWRHEKATAPLPERIDDNHDDDVAASKDLWTSLQRLPPRQREPVR